MPFNTTKLIISIAISELAGIVGAIFTISSPTWYATLTKPSFTPPDWIFGPVWTLLYLLMGIALYRIWQQGLEQKSVRFAFWIFIAHLGFNALWSILFFGLHNILYAFVDIVVLWVFIAALIILFWRIDRWAAYLLIPYLIWVSFAAVLNYSFLTLNSGTQAKATANVVTEVDDREFLSLPGSGIWFSYPKGWFSYYTDPSESNPNIPKDAPMIINLMDYEVPAATSGLKPGSEYIGIAVFTPEIFAEYKKKDMLKYYLLPGFEQEQVRSDGQSTWKSDGGYKVVEVMNPAYHPSTDNDYGPSPTKPVLAALFSVELKNGSIMAISATYATLSDNERLERIETHRKGLYQKTKDLVQSIRPL